MLRLLLCFPTHLKELSLKIDLPKKKAAVACSPNLPNIMGPHGESPRVPKKDPEERYDASQVVLSSLFGRVTVKSEEGFCNSVFML